MAPRSTRASEVDTRFDRRQVSDGRNVGPTGSPLGRRRADDAPAARQLASRTAAAPDQAAPRKRRATRDGREQLVVYLLPSAIKALKIAAVEQDTTASAIVAEAVTAWLKAVR